MQDLDGRFLHHPPHHDRISHNSDLGPFSNSDDTYAMMVLDCKPGCTEDDVDQELVRVAGDVGIEIPQSPKKPSLELIIDHVSNLALAMEEPGEGTFSPSRAFQSTHPLSDCCSEIKHPTTTSSFTTGSIASAPSSIISNTSSRRRSSYEKIKKGIRRLSTLRRRKTIDAPLPLFPLPPSSSLYMLKPARQKRILPSSDPFSIAPSPPGTECISLITPPSRTPPPVPIQEPSAESQRVSEHTSDDATHDLSPDFPSSPPPEKEASDSSLAALHRSLQTPQLKSLRASQLEEQDRFIRYEALQHHLLRISQVTSKRELQAHHTSQQKSLRSHNDEILSSIEHRHLCAEVDLHEKLQLEKKGCDTRLRHMQAYCYPTAAAADMPERTVTSRDYQYLEQQRYIRAGIDQLHAARINVLREKQAKQLELISAKQEAEMATLLDSQSEEIVELDKRAAEEESVLVKEFRARRTRLVKRWKLAEAIKRRRLEMEGSGDLGPLPEVEWGIWGWN